MFFIHPIIQTIAIVLSLYVYCLGFQRFRSAHLKQRAVFHWKQHVRLGITTVIVLIFGTAIGLLVVRIAWHGYMVTGTHAKVGVALTPLILFSLLSGTYMNKVKKKRTILPLLHGVNNTVLVILALSQFATGGKVLRQFVLGH